MTELNHTKPPRTSIYYSIKTVIAPSTIQWKISAIKSFLHYINSVYETWLDYEKIEQRRVRSPMMSVLTDEEFEQLYNIIPKVEKYKINILRSQLLVKLWFTSWMRLSEMLSLKVEDIRAWKVRIVWKGGCVNPLNLSTLSKKRVEKSTLRFAAHCSKLNIQ